MPTGFRSGGFPRRISLTHEEDLRAVERTRSDVRKARHLLITRLQPFMGTMPTRLDFIDETSVFTAEVTASGTMRPARRT